MGLKGERVPAEGAATEKAPWQVLTSLAFWADGITSRASPADQSACEVW